MGGHIQSSGGFPCWSHWDELWESKNRKRLALRCGRTTEVVNSTDGQILVGRESGRWVGTHEDRSRLPAPLKLEPPGRHTYECVFWGSFNRRVFPDVYLRRVDSLWRKGHHLWAWSQITWKGTEEKVSWMPALRSLCFLMVDTTWPAAWPSYCSASPTKTVLSNQQPR